MVKWPAGVARPGLPVETGARKTTWPWSAAVSHWVVRLTSISLGAGRERAMAGAGRLGSVSRKARMRAAIQGGRVGERMGDLRSRGARCPYLLPSIVQMAGSVQMAPSGGAGDGRA